MFAGKILCKCSSGISLAYASLERRRLGWETTMATSKGVSKERTYGYKSIKTVASNVVPMHSKGHS